MSERTEPVVSVAMRTYEHAPFVAQAIESVLIQEAPFEFELVIGEDCSADGTREIVEGYAERFPQRVRTILPAENVGHGEILRRVLDAGRGRFVAYLDGDDYWTSTAKLRSQVDHLESHPEQVSCFHDASLVFGAAGAPSGVTTPALAESSFALEDILTECFIPSPAMAFRREIVGSLPEWAFESAWIDWLIHIRCAELGPIGYIPEPMAAYRVHDGGMFSALDRIPQIEEDLRFYEQLRPELPDQVELIDRCIQLRGAQLAVERLGVPFSACVVLVDPRREMKPYFNGRHARNLPRRLGREVTELEMIRRAAAYLGPTRPDYGAKADPTREGGCFVVATASAREWLADREGLRDYLAREARVVWEDGEAIIYELPLQVGKNVAKAQPTRQLAIRRDPELPAELVGANLDVSSGMGDTQPAHAVTAVGWVLGRDEPVEAIELWVEGERLWRAPVNLPRPDIEGAFPDRQVGTPGFRTTVNVQRLPAGASAEVCAVLPGERRARFAELCFEDGSGG